MLPILISVSLAPVSYFFWASAGFPAAATIARPRKTGTKPRVIGVGILQTPWIFFAWQQGLLLSSRSLIQWKTMFATKSPLRRHRRGYGSSDFRKAVWASRRRRR